MNVFCLYRGEFSDRGLVGVFSTLQAAVEHVADRVRRQCQEDESEFEEWRFEDYDIEEVAVDALAGAAIRQAFSAGVDMRDGAEHGHIDEAWGRPNDLTPMEAMKYTGRGVLWNIGKESTARCQSFVSMAHALELAREKRRKELGR